MNQSKIMYFQGVEHGINISQNSQNSKITFLGTGFATGVPIVCCSCSVCQSSLPENQRTRSSIHLQYNDFSLLVDTSPDLRFQVLREKIQSIDAVLFTHSHLDHIGGFDDLRSFSWNTQIPIPIYLHSACLKSLKIFFPWIFEKQKKFLRYTSVIAHKIKDTSFTLQGMKITPFPVKHDKIPTLGFLFENQAGKSMAYIPDICKMEEKTLKHLLGVDILILNALREAPSLKHLTVRESLVVAQRSQAKQIYLTHLSHEIDYEDLSRKLPENIHLAYDGLQIFF